MMTITSRKPAPADRITFDLKNGHGWRIRFRHPKTPLMVDGVIWSTQGDLTCLSLDGALTYLVPERVVQHLCTVV